MLDPAVLADHYHNSCDLTRDRERRRERLLLFVALILAGLLLQVHDDDKALSLAQDITEGFISPENMAANIAIIRGALWIVLVVLVQAYYQTDIAIERSYLYIHALEEQLNAAFGGKSFTREGKSYTETYPWFLEWTWIFYKWIVPLSIITVPGINIVLQALSTGFLESEVFFRIFIWLLLIIATILYLRLIHWRK